MSNEQTTPMTQEDDNLCIYIKGGNLETGADLNSPDTMGTLTVEVTVKARYKDIKEFMAIDKYGIEHLNKLIAKPKETPTAAQITT